MTKPISSKSLFEATRAKRPAPVLPIDLPLACASDAVRRADDFYPTAPTEPIRALLAADWARISALGAVWEPAVGDGALAREIRDAGFSCHGSDLVDRGFAGVEVRSFYDFTESPAPVIITNPPFCEINARDGHGRWLRHTLGLPGWRYCALLLSWDWPAARANGLGELIEAHSWSWSYLMRWKVDFTGAGSPPQRNGWFVWDRDDPRSVSRAGGLPEPSFRFLDRDQDWRQAGFSEKLFQGARP